MLDMFQITEAAEKYKSSMEKIGKAIGLYSANPQLDKIFYFELSLFCFLTGNNDMHLKNFSMIQSPSGWILSPAYDLLNVAIVLPEDTEELALPIMGKKRKLQWQHFLAFGKKLGLNEKQILAARKRMLRYKSTATQLIEQSFLSEPVKMAYQNLMDARYTQLFPDLLREGKK